MSKGDISAVEQTIANTINETARGDPDTLAARIVAALAAAGYGIVPVNGIEDTALSTRRAEMRQLYQLADQFGALAEAPSFAKSRAGAMGLDLLPATPRAGGNE
jgi:hypothetical protein